MRSRAEAARAAAGTLLVLASAAAGPAQAPPQARARIMRPVDGAALATGPVSILATAPDGRLELDGTPIESERPYPAVLRAEVRPGPGTHRLALVWTGGRQELGFWVGPQPPAEFHPFRSHPPFAVECGACHGLRDGRFAFQGGCFQCHAAERFPLAHTHTSDELATCGLCHNAHGATERALLVAPREKACSRCHPLR